MGKEEILRLIHEFHDSNNIEEKCVLKKDMKQLLTDIKLSKVEDLKLNAWIDSHFMAFKVSGVKMDKIKIIQALT